MGKKKLRSKYTSKGQRKSMNPKVCNAVRHDRSMVDIALNKMDAFLRGNDVWMTIDNPNHLETNKRKIRVKAHTLFGDWRKFGKLPKLADGAST